MFLKYLLDFEFLFFVFFLEIFSWKGASCFNGGCYSLHGGALLLSGGGRGGLPHGRGLKKIVGWGETLSWWNEVAS